MRSKEIRFHRTIDTTCRACGRPVAAPRFFDTRGHHYCAPECWESVDTAPPPPPTSAEAAMEMH